MALVTLTRQGETLVVDDSVIDQYLFAGWSAGQAVTDIVHSEADPIDGDGRPDGTLWLKVTP